jgi:hypothetical protein
MLEKISAEQVDHLMVKAAHVIRTLEAEVTELRAEKAERARRDHAEKIASSAVERGIMEAEEAADYATSLAESDKDLSMVEDFVDRTAAGIPLGGGLEKEAHAEGGGDTDVLTSYLLSNPIPG